MQPAIGGGRNAMPLGSFRQQAGLGQVGDVHARISGGVAGVAGVLAVSGGRIGAASGLRRKRTMRCREVTRLLFLLHMMHGTKQCLVVFSHNEINSHVMV